MIIVKGSDKPKHSISFYHAEQKLLPQYQNLNQNPKLNNPACLVFDNIKGDGGNLVEFPKLNLIGASQFLPHKLYEIIAKYKGKPILVISNRRETHAYIREQGSNKWHSVSVLAAENFDQSNLHLTASQIQEQTEQEIKDFILFSQPRDDKQVSIKTREFFSKKDLTTYLAQPNLTQPQIEKATKALDKIKHTPDEITLKFPLEVKTEKEIVEEVGAKFLLMPSSDHSLVEYQPLAEIENKHRNYTILSHCHGGNGRAKQSIFNLAKSRLSCTNINVTIHDIKEHLSWGYIKGIAGDTSPWFRFASLKHNSTFKMGEEKQKRKDLLK
ncbi:MAG: hypothetical protein RLZZ210_719 [Pseudomonadota bacterium]|jgi:hypothetical protein